MNDATAVEVLAKEGEVLLLLLLFPLVLLLLSLTLLMAVVLSKHP